MSSGESPPNERKTYDFITYEVSLFLIPDEEKTYLTYKSPKVDY